MVHRFLAAVSAALVILAGAMPRASAFCRTTTCGVQNPPAECGAPGMRRHPVTSCLLAGAPLFWQESCVSFSLHQDASPELLLDYATAEAIVAEGFAAWPAATCGAGNPSTSAWSIGPIQCDVREFNWEGPNSNAVIFRGRDWPHDRRAIALTTVSFEAGTGRILGADMEINSEHHPLTPTSLKYVVTHEAGHFFGLDHSSDSSAVMYEGYSLLGSMPAANQPLLTPDDVSGICAIYPSERARSATCDPEPEKGFATDCGGNVVGSCAFEPAGSAERGPRKSGFFAGSLSALLLALWSFRRNVRSRTTASDHFLLSRRKGCEMFRP